jgi:predicted nucleic acid-binding protein
VDAFVASGPALLVSNLAMAEFAATVGVRLRRGDLDAASAREALVKVEHWSHREAQVVPVEASDIDDAVRHLARLDLRLRAPDAIHIAAAARLRARLLTFDTAQAAAAKALGLALEPA